MKNSSSVGLCTTIAFGVAVLALPAFAQVSAVGNRSCAEAACHADQVHSVTAHAMSADAEICGTCHISEDRHEHRFRIADNSAGVCLDCHSDLQAGQFSHQSSASGLCTLCHGVHQTDHEGLLKLPRDALCLTCHDDVVPDESIIVHGPVLEGNCTACHDPHSAENDNQLVKPVPELCFDCHDTEQTDHEGRPLAAVEQTYVDPAVTKHPPFGRGACLLCHDAHASDNFRLQRRPYERAFYTEFSSESYFCLMCHGDTTFAEPRTTVATQFRNGNLNLHYRHVARDKGRGCRACHNQHGSVLDALIATETYFGEQNVGIRTFAKTETGGTCEPLCHRSVRYDRLDPVDNEMMVTPREGTDATAAELRRTTTEQAGSLLYLQRCAGCHGEDAGGLIGPPISGASQERVLAAINRVDLMSDLASLDADDLNAIITSLPAGTPIIVPASGDPDGVVLFATNCAGCHGADARGNIGPAIRNADRDRIAAAVDTVPMMVAMKALSDGSLGMIADYLGSLDAETTTASTTPITDLPDGRVLFAMNCLGCHGDDAQGRIGPAIRGLAASDVRDAIDRVPMMAGLATLNTAEITAVGDYLGAFDLPAEAVSNQIDAGIAFYASACSACHGEDGAGHIGPDITGRSADDVRAAIERVPMMLGVIGSTDQQIEAVGQYLLSLGDDALVASLEEQSDGETIFNQRCAACHGPNATGRVGPDITQASVDDIALAIEQVPMMVAMKILSVTEIRAAALYLASLHNSNPQPVAEP